MGKIFSSFIENCHCSSNNTINDEELTKIRQDINMIKGNHLHHIENDINELKMDIKIINSTLIRIESRL